MIYRLLPFDPDPETVWAHALEEVLNQQAEAGWRFAGLVEHRDPAPGGMAGSGAGPLRMYLILRSVQ